MHGFKSVIKFCDNFKLKEKIYIFNTDLVTLLFFSFRACLLPLLGAPSGLLRSPPHGSPRATADSDIPIKTAICCLKSPPSLSVRGPSTKPAGGGGLYLDGGLFDLEKTMVSVLHKELEYKVIKLRYKKLGGHAAEDQNQIRTSSWQYTIPEQSARSFAVVVD